MRLKFINGLKINKIKIVKFLRYEGRTEIRAGEDPHVTHA